MQKKANRVYGKALHTEEIRDAEEDIIRKVQSEIFSEEYKTLKSKKAISPKSPLIKLSPRIDENGIIRMDGRLTNADHLPYDVKHPIILPRTRGSDLYFSSIVAKILDNSSTGRDSKLGKRMQQMQEEEDQARNPNNGPTAQSSS